MITKLRGDRDLTASTEVHFEARPNPIIFSIWTLRSVSIFLLPVILIAILLSYLRFPSYFHSNLSSIIDICISMYLVGVIISIPLGIFLATRRRIRVTEGCVEIFTVDVHGEFRELRQYFFPEIDCIRVGRSWFNHANINVKRRETASSGDGYQIPHIQYFDDSFFHLKLLDDLQKNVLYGIHKYEEFITAVVEQAKSQG